MTGNKLLTAQELASILGLSVDTIWRYTRDQRIPHIEIGPRQYRYVEAEVLRSLGRYRTPDAVCEEPAPYTSCDPSPDPDANANPSPDSGVSFGKMTHAEFAKLPAETGYILQLIDGLLVREPTPTYRHQRVSRRLQQILIAYFEKTDPHGEVFDAPLDVYLNDYTVVQPDLFYLPGARPAQNDPVDSLPELAIEILSPATARTDRIRKLNSYQKAGVPHYWIVDPGDGLIECYRLENDHYVAIVRAAEGLLAHPDFPGLTLDLQTLFAEV
ncbi:MAG TPA: DNA-binding protein [Firmicutes bacterium]|jgi:excisionase family DNA binding protein|nr:DNA-binding protein [Bacillota bacterium]HAW72171.1 DNA-binding protein [Bacillota bacterium]HBE05164.1 DNA-binding protein [Bacillota bacterium]HBL50192.1 DNA-binding protein [Bacillota bacterium]HBL68428.1 DNA-binding protein [Bacillota bacterium]